MSCMRDKLVGNEAGDDAAAEEGCKCNQAFDLQDGLVAINISDR